MQAIRAARGGLLALLVLTAIGCSTPAPRYPGGDLLRFDATVTRVEIEGGFWGLVTGDGTRYDPRGLPHRFQRDGVAVHVVAEPMAVATTGMWGESIRIVSIRQAD